MDRKNPQRGGEIAKDSGHHQQSLQRPGGRECPGTQEHALGRESKSPGNTGERLHGFENFHRPKRLKHRFSAVPKIELLSYCYAPKSKSLKNGTAAFQNRKTPDYLSPSCPLVTFLAESIFIACS